MRPASTLDQPQVRCHLVGAVDGQVEPVQEVEWLDGKAQRSGGILRGGRGSHADQIRQIASGYRGQEVGNGRPRPQPQAHAAFHRLRRSLCRSPLLVLTGIHGQTEC